MKLTLCLAAVLVFPASLASAQGNPGPFGGLFGRTPGRTGVNFNVFEIRGSGGGHWGTGLLGQPQDESGRQPAGVNGNVAAGATFERRTDRLNFSAVSNAQYEQTLQSNPIGGTTVGAGFLFSSRLTTRVTTEARANYSYSPYFQFYPSFVSAGTGLIVPGLPYAATATENHIGEARLDASFQYSKSSTLSAGASRTQTVFPTASDSDFRSTGYHGLWRRRLNRDFGLRLGYSRSRVEYQASDSPGYIFEELDAGVEFSRAFTVSPRTTMAFRTTTSIIRRTDIGRHFRLNGEFNLARRFRRTWQASLNASRATQFIAGYVEPVFTHTLGGSVSGLLADRVEWVTSVYGSRGDVGFDRSGGQYEIVGAITQLNFAVTRHIGIYNQLGFYRHDVPSQASSIPVPGRLSRQVFSAGITAWLPVYTRERTPSDSR